jgi:serine/threonine protein kinase
VHDTVAPELPAVLDLGLVAQGVPDELRAALEEKYEFVELLGAGGVSQVWSARTASDELVAIKVVQSPSVGARLGDLLALKHPHIVRTREVVGGEEAAAQVMDIVSGPTLANVTVPLPATVVVRICDRLLDALEYLDSKGWMRFDIKPANVLMRGPEDPVMIDLDTHVVRGGDEHVPDGLVGTPAYSAPEAFAGEVDIRSDLYSLAVSMAVMLGSAHRAPFGTFDPASYPVDVRPDPSDLSVSVELRALLKLALEERADKRFGSPAEMRDALHRTPEWELGTGG